jgi:hypothetical protein
VLRAAAWVLTTAAIVELCAREVARRSIIERLTGSTPGAVALLFVLAIAASASIVPTGAKPRDSSGRTVLLLAALFAVGLAFQLQLGARLQSDGFYYFAYLRSLAFDHDVDFTNDYKLLGLDDKPHLFVPTPTGHAQSAASIGPAILWAPFFGAGHLVARSLGARHPDINANGISFPYRQAVCVAGLFYGLIGCWFCFRLTRRFYGSALAGLAVSLTVSGSFLLWYLVQEPSMTHGPSMAAVAAFVWTWIATRDVRMSAAQIDAVPLRSRALTHWAWLGVVAGIMTLIRWQNALFAVLPAIDAVAVLVRSARASDTARVRRVMTGGVAFCLCATVVFLPQMIAWRGIYGSWLAVSPLGPQIRWFHPQLADILWSSRNGLLSWSPILYAGAIGFVMFARRQPAVGAPMLAGVILMTYFNACIQDWWGSDGFGGRRFDGTIPFFCLGVAAIAAAAAALVRRHPLRTVAIGGAALVLWNLTLMNAANTGVFRLGSAVSFGDTGAAQGRALHTWFGNPFTYPASLVFAARNGVPPARYDLLSANRFLSDPLRPYGRVDIGADDAWMLGDGWHGPEQEGPVSFRWAASPAEVLIPLDHAAPLRVQVRLHAFAYPGSAPQSVGISVNNHAFAPVNVGAGWQTVEFATEASAWRAGVNRLRLDFAMVRSPAQAGLSGDGRPLAAAVDYIRLAAR